jgi:hypothetical protein
VIVEGLGELMSAPGRAKVPLSQLRPTVTRHPPSTPQTTRRRRTPQTHASKCQQQPCLEKARQREQEEAEEEEVKKRGDVERCVARSDGALRRNEPVPTV